MYQAELGRFMTRDPLPQEGEPDLLYDNNEFGAWLDMMKNLYGYSSSDPVNRADSTGLKSHRLCSPGQTKEFNRLGGCSFTEAHFNRLYDLHQQVYNRLYQRSRDGINDSLVDVAKQAKIVANAGGHRSSSLMYEPEFYRNAVEDLEDISKESGLIITASSLALGAIVGWGAIVEDGMKAVGLRRLTSGLDTGTGDTWFLVEMKRTKLFMGRLRVVRERILKIQSECDTECLCSRLGLNVVDKYGPNAL